MIHDLVLAEPRSRLESRPAPHEPTTIMSALGAALSISSVAIPLTAWIAAIRAMGHAGTRSQPTLRISSHNRL